MVDNLMCRTCQATNGLMSIFDENGELVVMLRRLACIFVKEDDLLPKLICYSCANSLKMASEFIVQCKKTDKILRERLDGVMFLEETLLKSSDDSVDDDRESIKIEPSETLQEFPLESDDNNVSVKIEPIERIIVESVTDQNNRIIAVEDGPENDLINPRYIDDNGMELNVDDLIEVDEEFLEEISDLDSVNYIEEKKITGQGATETSQLDIVEPSTKSSTKSKRVPLTSKVKKRNRTRITASKTYNCPICSATSTDYAEFILHKKTHYPYRHACKVCGRQFVKISGLRSHMDIHNGIKFPCHLCIQQCSSPYNLIRHIRETHDKIQPFSCEVCGRQFSQRTTLIQHAGTHTEERDYVCDICDKTFKTRGALYIHKKRHRPDFVSRRGRGVYICEHCGKKSNSVGAFLQHKQTHSDVKEFECELCHKRFNLKATLSFHMRIHTDERPYTCDTCGKGFRQQVHMKTHRLRFHEPEAARRYTCKCCGKRFTSGSTLKVHERIHTGEKPFKCDICSLRFIDTNCLKRHRRKVHSIDTPNARKVVVLDERNSITTHESDIGQLSLGQEYIVEDQDFVSDSWNELVGTEL